MTTSRFPPGPDALFGPLFHDVQLSPIFPDSKTFVDCIPKEAPADLLARYETERQQPDFDLGQFVQYWFTLPDNPATGFISDPTHTTGQHINRLWDYLTLPADVMIPYDSRLPLPYPYVVPGGRFREIFYWDSYFTMLGLRQSGRVTTIRHMLDNFAYLIDTYGHIPNGNRTYFLSRSQPPFFALMVQLLADIEGPAVLVTYLSQLQQEYTFWMEGADQLTAEQSTHRRVVRLADGSVLNRYWDDEPLPRPEAYRQELELLEKAEALGSTPVTLYRHLRAACESGWDFSSRWFTDPQNMATIRAADLLPVDLNCLLYSLETTLSLAYRQTGQLAESTRFTDLAQARKNAILTYFWNEEHGFFTDYDFIVGEPAPALTLAGLFPLFVKLATTSQAQAVAKQVETNFLKPGGVVTTLHRNGQQWDTPNGWAPLQWITYQALRNYEFADLATSLRDRWLALNDRVFRETGKLMEKYNVVDDNPMAGGGEYPNQDGFGWTNGVYLAMLADAGGQ